MSKAKSPMLWQRGFTLIELMVVVIIVGVLAAVGVPAYQEYVDKSRLVEAYAAVDALQKAQISNYLANGYFINNVSFNPIGSTTQTVPPKGTKSKLESRTGFEGMSGDAALQKAVQIFYAPVTSVIQPDSAYFYALGLAGGFFSSTTGQPTSYSGFHLEGDKYLPTMGESTGSTSLLMSFQLSRAVSEGGARSDTSCAFNPSFDTIGISSTRGNYYSVVYAGALNRDDLGCTMAFQVVNATQNQISRLPILQMNLNKTITGGGSGGGDTDVDACISACRGDADCEEECRSHGGR